MLSGKPLALVKVYQVLEGDLAKWGPHETFAGDRYALFRTTRGFADLVFMRDSLRLALYLGRRVAAPCFFKVGKVSANRVIHVARLRTLADWRTVRPYLKEAYLLALPDDASNPSTTPRPGPQKKVRSRRRLPAV
jgi:hypothetical protein